MQLGEMMWLKKKSGQILLINIFKRRDKRARDEGVMCDSKPEAPKG